MRTPPPSPPRSVGFMRLRLGGRGRGTVSFLALLVSGNLLNIQVSFLAMPVLGNLLNIEVSFLTKLVSGNYIFSI